MPSKRDARNQSSSPDWLINLAKSPHKRGFFISHDGFAIQFTDRGSGTLYVGFDNLAGVRAKTRLRDPWGYAFAQKSGWSHLGILAYHPKWYRDAELFSALEKIATDGLFDNFDRVAFIGASMGGYAACAFSSLAPRSLVIAFSPQSTLKPDLVPWETRYQSGRMADWSGPYSDAAEELRHAKKAWIVYDPKADLDHRHALRLQGENVTLLNARRTNHFTAQFMGNVGILSSFVRECIDDTMTNTRFYELFRQRRRGPAFLQHLVNDLQPSSQTARKNLMAAVLRQMKKPRLAERLEKNVTS